MTTIKTRHGCLQNINFHADKPFLKKPKIIGEKLVDGVKFYLGEEGKEYVCDLFNKMFGCAKGVIKKKSYKGELIGKKYLLNSDVVIIGINKDEVSISKYELIEPNL